MLALLFSYDVVLINRVDVAETSKAVVSDAGTLLLPAAVAIECQFFRLADRGVTWVVGIALHPAFGLSPCSKTLQAQKHCCLVDILTCCWR
ncbi:MAG: hypothetical protein A3C49_00905 [Candidatus Doudnabacteria bacterium RIFCSPHIGHO2_02_FULL_42_25]|nr:MAG: hypothetical protein A3E28_03280 [Candidatus Doudnabacteria bacterium RIFCSPHIGHO2_12_FULL_42_22]OGE87281.1 MAG: hypothetical protein A3C49_00905 [Candidatus Doudnabacteria bacterium RIFCSPHIGHO2_02_FULL_42_25]OGE92118.1 MAG: hypothetical protein A2895_00780 [Candidatus Doudnabacteria bacterium RIFCSPLOWO2_01_FULL_42_60]OGE98277.1 MAG: hypothetical protein A3G89_00500 [Candidatus Doudnabacteria bacterium RIFCSPLOWO2_12_FULL_42_9]